VSDQSKDIRITVSLTSGQAEEFLRRLAEERDFRTHLQEAPVDELKGTLAEALGLDIPSEWLPEKRNLPDEETSTRIWKTVQKSKAGVDTERGAVNGALIVVAGWLDR
jgi:hypothetical protein